MYSRAIELNASLDMAYFDRAVAYYNTQQYELSKADFLIVLQLDTSEALKAPAREVLTEMGVDVPQTTN